MRFKGNIIITDPCYICKEKKEVGEYPKAKDYFSHSREKYYPDYRKMDENEIKALEEEIERSINNENFLRFPDGTKICTIPRHLLLYELGGKY